MAAASGNSNPEVIMTLVKAGADVNARNNKGETPLMFAAGNNPNSEGITILLEAGADVNARDNEKRTPLTVAAYYNSSPEVLRVLVKEGADVNAKDKDNRTPLLWATVTPRFSIEKMKILLNNGANLEGVEEYLLNEEKFSLLYQHPEGQKYFGNLIEAVKNSYWGDYSAKDGYAPLGEAFEIFFSKPKWAVSYEGLGGIAVVFTGVAQSNNRNAMFKVLFTVNERSIQVKNLTINGKEADWSNLLAAVHLGN